VQDNPPDHGGHDHGGHDHGGHQVDQGDLPDISTQGTQIWDDGATVFGGYGTIESGTRQRNRNRPRLTRGEREATIICLVLVFVIAAICLAAFGVILVPSREDCIFNPDISWFC